MSHSPSERIKEILARLDESADGQYIYFEISPETAREFREYIRSLRNESGYVYEVKPHQDRLTLDGQYWSVETLRAALKDFGGKGTRDHCRCPCHARKDDLCEQCCDGPAPL